MACHSSQSGSPTQILVPGTGTCQNRTLEPAFWNSTRSAPCMLDFLARGESSVHGAFDVVVLGCCPGGLLG